MIATIEDKELALDRVQSVYAPTAPHLLATLRTLLQQALSSPSLRLILMDDFSSFFTLSDKKSITAITIAISYLTQLATLHHATVGYTFCLRCF